MNSSTLTTDRLKELLHYDQDTGVFTWNVRRSGKTPAGSVAGSYDAYGYIQIRISPFRYKAHRLAWFYVNSEWPKFCIDHINGVRDDNRIANLRDVTNQINIQNKRSPTGSNLYLGCSFNKSKNKWQAKIKLNGKYIHLGWFGDPDDASAAYISAKRELHAGCTI